MLNELRRLLRGLIPVVPDDLVAPFQHEMAHGRHTLRPVVAGGHGAFWPLILAPVAPTAGVHGTGQLRRAGHGHGDLLAVVPVAAARWRVAFVCGAGEDE